MSSALYPENDVHIHCCCFLPPLFIRSIHDKLHAIRTASTKDNLNQFHIAESLYAVAYILKNYCTCERKEGTDE